MFFENLSPSWGPREEQESSEALSWKLIPALESSGSRMVGEAEGFSRQSWPQVLAEDSGGRSQ